MDQDKIKSTILRNAAEIDRLQEQFNDAIAGLDCSVESAERRLHAAAEFRARHDPLAFPGGYAGALERISSGDPFSVEAAICFLELRPYFFRSGYMFKDILRKCKHAPLSESQAARLAVVTKNLADWRATHPRPGVLKWTTLYAYDRTSRGNREPPTET